MILTARRREKHASHSMPNRVCILVQCSTLRRGPPIPDGVKLIWLCVTSRVDQLADQTQYSRLQTLPRPAHRRHREGQSQQLKTPDSILPIVGPSLGIRVWGAKMLGRLLLGPCLKTHFFEPDFRACLPRQLMRSRRKAPSGFTQSRGC